MNKLIILQTVAPDYRKKFFQCIKGSLNNNFTLYAGKEYFENSVKTDESITFLKNVKNHYFFYRKFLFQTGMWQDCLKSNTLVMEMNPRIISNWILLITRLILRRKNVLWGHAWPRNGRNSNSDKLRNIMRLLADEIIVYTKTQAKELKEKMPNKTINAAPNAVFYKSEMVISDVPYEDINNIIYVGRLTEAKKALFLVDAFIKIIDDLPNKVRLIIVGEGEEKSKIINLVARKKLENRVQVMGHIGDYDTLQNLYSKSLLSISPGYVGLSITQSFGFGVPMLISKNEKHSPEIEAVIKGENACFFETDDIESFKNKLLSFFEQKKYWINKRTSISEYCKENYSTEKMAESFINLAH